MFHAVSGLADRTLNPEGGSSGHAVAESCNPSAEARDDALVFEQFGIIPAFRVVLDFSEGRTTALPLSCPAISKNQFNVPLKVWTRHASCCERFVSALVSISIRIFITLYTAV